MGQLVKCSAPSSWSTPQGLNKIQGQPFKVAEIEARDPRSAQRRSRGHARHDSPIDRPSHASSPRRTSRPTRTSAGARAAATTRSSRPSSARSPELGMRKRENTVFVSGIGCSSRFPYYMNTYGFHTIHGRAPAIATGLKIANPELDVWVITGDGDGLSIGGNHLIHALRRNVDLKILLFNNQIYGLTKGQYSPTSPLGKRAPSTPIGSVDNPLNPIAFALGCGATFVARAVDTDAKQPRRRSSSAPTRTRARRSSRCSRTAPSSTTAPSTTSPSATSPPKPQLHLEHGKPMLFGKDNNKGLRLRPAARARGRHARRGRRHRGATSSCTTRHNQTHGVPARQPRAARLPGRARRAVQQPGAGPSRSSAACTSRTARPAPAASATSTP